MAKGCSSCAAAKARIAAQAKANKDAAPDPKQNAQYVQAIKMGQTPKK